MVRDHVEEARQRALASLLLETDERIEDELCGVESPIERAFFYALLQQPLRSYGWGVCAGGWRLGPAGPVNGIYGRAEPEDFGGAREGALEVWPQVGVDRYRVDFLLRLSAGSDVSSLLLVELDGHDSHERTKAQARHDRRRDRRMVELGLTVFRFTGSEIYADVDGCVAQCRAYLKAALERAIEAEIARMEAAGI